MTLKHLRCLHFFYLFINSSTVYKYSHRKCSPKKQLMSRKHSCPPRLAGLSSFIVCCVVHKLPNIYLFKNTRFTVPCWHSRRNLVRGIALLHTHPIAFAGTCPVEWSCAVTARSGMKGKKPEITVWSRSSLTSVRSVAGPEVRSGTVLRGSPSSLVCGGGGWG